MPAGPVGAVLIPECSEIRLEPLYLPPLLVKNKVSILRGVFIGVRVSHGEVAAEKVPPICVRDAYIYCVRFRVPRVPLLCVFLFYCLAGAARGDDLLRGDSVAAGPPHPTGALPSQQPGGGA